jgi:hypothetical protein
MQGKPAAEGIFEMPSKPTTNPRERGNDAEHHTLRIYLDEVAQQPRLHPISSAFGESSNQPTVVSGESSPLLHDDT